LGAQVDAILIEKKIGDRVWGLGDRKIMKGGGAAGGQPPKAE
jgi:predicted NAD-dependent protein-ADP-ribosyltransferase YbiA (DUF1768 family)